MIALGALIRAPIVVGLVRFYPRKPHRCAALRTIGMWNLRLRTRGMYVVHDAFLLRRDLSLSRRHPGQCRFDDNGRPVSEKPSLRASRRNLRTRYVIVSCCSAKENRAGKDPTRSLGGVKMSAEKLNQRPGLANKKTVNPHDMSEAQKIGATIRGMAAPCMSAAGCRGGGW